MRWPGTSPTRAFIRPKFHTRPVSCWCEILDRRDARRAVRPPSVRSEVLISFVTPLDWVGRAVEAAADKKANDLVVLDVGELLGITDYFLICSGSSERQVHTIADAVEERLRGEGLKALRSEGAAESGWILIDYGDFIVHIFSDQMRAYYDLERLWKDAPQPELSELAEARQALGS